MIRKAKLNDIDKINILGEQLHQNFTILYHIDKELDNNLAIVLVNVDNNEVINAYLYAQNFDDNIDLLSIFVDNNYRHQHIGTNLINYLISNYPNKTITLEVSSNNKEALALYNSVGFKNVGIRKNYYVDSDAIIMKWGI